MSDFLLLNDINGEKCIANVSDIIQVKVEIYADKPDENYVVGKTLYLQVKETPEQIYEMLNDPTNNSN